MRYEFDFSAPLTYWPDFVAGAATTLGLSMVATVFGFLLGVLCALGTTGRSAWVARVCNVYVETIRNTPLLVQIFIVYFGLLGRLQGRRFYRGRRRPGRQHGRLHTEIMRAGIQSIHAHPAGGCRMPGPAPALQIPMSCCCRPWSASILP